MIAICRNHRGFAYTHYLIDHTDPRAEKLLSACGIYGPLSKLLAEINEKEITRGERPGGYWARQAAKNEDVDYGDGDIDSLLTFAGPLEGADS